MGQGTHAHTLQIRRIVLDTNCLLMSLPKASPYRRVWDSFLSGEITLCVSNDIIEEYLEILTQKTNHYVADNVVSTIINRKNVRLVTPYFKLHIIKEDEDDNKFVDCAFAAGVDCIVSNDAHFNALKKVGFPTIPVLRLEEFTTLLTRNHNINRPNA